MKPVLIAGALAWSVASASLVAAHADTPRLLEEVNRELGEHPNDPERLLRRGHLYLDEEYHNYPQAIADLTVALKDPALIDASLYRGVAFLRSGDLVKARRDLDAFVRRMPNDGRGYEARADLWLASKDERAAIADLAAAAAINPRLDLYTRAAALQVTARDTAGAIRTCEDGLARLGRPLELVATLIDIALAGQAYDKALQAIAAQEAQGGRPEPWMLRRGKVLALSGRQDEAGQAYREVLRHLDARATNGGVLNQTMLIEKAQALLGLGRRDEAKGVLAALGPAVQGRAEYQKLAAELTAR